MPTRTVTPLDAAIAAPDGGRSGRARYMAGVDRAAAIACYALLFLAPFMVGLPALAGLALSFARRNDAHSLMRSHYRFQGRLFWTAMALLASSLILLIGGGGMAAAHVAGLVQTHVSGAGARGWIVPAAAAAARTPNAALAAGVLTALLAVAWLMGGSAYGFVKLVLGRPIRHRGWRGRSLA